MYLHGVSEAGLLVALNLSSRLVDLRRHLFIGEIQFSQKKNCDWFISCYTN